MEEKFGIDQIKPVLKFAIELGNVGDAMGRLKGPARWGKLTELTDEIFGMTAVNWELFVKQVKDIDAAEKAQIGTFLTTELDIANDDLEEIIEEGLIAVISLAQVVTSSIKLARKRKEVQGEANEA